MSTVDFLFYFLFKLIIQSTKKLHVRKEWLDYLNSQDYPLSYELQTAKNIACALQLELESYIQTRIK